MSTWRNSFSFQILDNGEWKDVDSVKDFMRSRNFSMEDVQYFDVCKEHISLPLDEYFNVNDIMASGRDIDFYKAYSVLIDNCTRIVTTGYCDEEKRDFMEILKDGLRKINKKHVDSNLYDEVFSKYKKERR